MSRLFLIGTDTHAGKTTVACALLRAARRRGVRVAPFKPAASGDAGPGSDVERLLDAAALPTDALDLVNPLRYAAPLAPGIAEHVAGFTRGEPPTHPDAILHARHALERLEARLDPELTLIEGAGGLHVPMPGGTWLPEWISALDARVLVIARAGLGTINHTVLTYEALRALGHEPLGFLTSQILPSSDPSRRDNVAVLERRLGARCLGALPHRRPGVADRDDGWLVPDWLAVLRSR